MDVMTAFRPVELQRIRKILEEIVSLDRQIEEYLQNKREQVNPKELAAHDWWPKSFYFKGNALPI